MSEVHHATVFFTGRVQGVGFRYQALQVAKGFEVSGFVMNLPDGRVQLEAEGAAAEVNEFIAAVQERMEGYIRKTEQSAAQRPPRFQGFAIQ
jgi:acylphosphatase